VNATLMCFQWSRLIWPNGILLGKTIAPKLNNMRAKGRLFSSTFVFYGLLLVSCVIVEPAVQL